MISIKPKASGQDINCKLKKREKHKEDFETDDIQKEFKRKGEKALVEKSQLIYFPFYVSH